MVDVFPAIFPASIDVAPYSPIALAKASVTPDMMPDNGAHCAIVSVNIADMDSAEVSDILMNEYGIATRSGIHCAPLMHKFFGTQKQGMVRFSFSYYNTNDEINEAAEALMQIAVFFALWQLC